MFFGKSAYLVAGKTAPSCLKAVGGGQLWVLGGQHLG
jgi:hypothetical protein